MRFGSVLPGSTGGPRRTRSTQRGVSNPSSSRSEPMQGRYMGDPEFLKSPETLLTPTVPLVSRDVLLYFPHKMRVLGNELEHGHAGF